SAADFRFQGSAPLAPAAAFAPWAALAAATAGDEPALAACLQESSACASNDLLRFRRMVAAAGTLSGRRQLVLVHEYFNLVLWSAERGGDAWQSLYRVAASGRGDCEDIAFAKYFALRRLGWAAEDLRVIVGWDQAERDWHALLAVRLDGETYVLDSILGL